MSKFDAYSMCQRYMNQYVNLRTTDGKSYAGYIGKVDRDKVYVAVPTHDVRGSESSDRSHGCRPRRPGCVSPAYYPPYYPPYYPVSPAYYPPRPRYPYPYPYPVPPYPVRRRGWNWVAISLAFLVGVGVGVIID